MCFHGGTDTSSPDPPAPPALPSACCSGQTNILRHFLFPPRSPIVSGSHCVFLEHILVKGEEGPIQLC